MASTRTDWITGQVEHKDLGGRKVVAENKISFADFNGVASDVVQVLKIPAGALVTKVSVVMLTPEDSTSTATVGDAADPNGWDASIDLEGAANTTYTSAEADAFGLAGKYYATADTIDLTMSAHATDTAIFNVTAEYSVLERI